MTDPRVWMWGVSAACGAASGFWLFAVLCGVRAVYLAAK